MRRAWLALVAALAIGGAAHGETLIVTLSTSEVQIASNFTGDSVAVFGAIEPEAGAGPLAGDYDVVVVLKGPDQDVVTRRKEHFLGVWVNRAAATLRDLPAFYAVHSTRPLGEIADLEALRQLELGIDNIAIEPAEALDPGTAFDFALAFRRLKAEDGLYVEAAPAVIRVGASVFQTNFVLPAHIPIGEFEARVYLFRGGTLVNEAGGTLTVSKTGFEQLLFVAAQRQPLLYGAAAVVLALLIGWLAGVIFRRD